MPPSAGVGADKVGESGAGAGLPPRRPLLKRLRRNGVTLVLLLPALLAVLFVLVPLGAVLLGTSTAAVLRALTAPDVLASFTLTFGAGLLATFLGLLTGVPLAYLLARGVLPGTRFIRGLMGLPVVIPHTAAGIALLMVFGRRGWLGEPLTALGLHFTDRLPGVVVGMLFVSLPFLVDATVEAFARIDPELELVAETLGATPWQAFWHVTLPLARPGILAGALMMWGRGISEFGAVVILAYHPKTVPVVVYERFTGFGLAAAQPVTVLLILASLAVFFLFHLLQRRVENASDV